MVINKLTVSQDTFEMYLRYKFEILLDMNESILKSSNKLIRDAIVVLGESEIHHQLEYHQKIMINFFYFKEENVLLDYIEWIYRVYYYKDLDMDYFLREFEFWMSSCKGYFNMPSMIEIEAIYTFLTQNHKTMKKRAISEVNVEQNRQIDEIYNLLITAKSDEVLELCKLHCDTIDKFGDYFTNILSKVMTKVGIMWETSEITVSKEHIASSTLEEITFELIDSFAQKPSKEKVVLLSNAPNEFHGLGLKIISKLLKKEGFSVINIGASAPSKDIIKAVEEFKPDFIMFGVTLVINLFDVALLIENLEKNIYDKSFKVIVGGNAFNNLEEPTKLMNADIYCKNINESISFVNEANI